MYSRIYLAFILLLSLFLVIPIINSKTQADDLAEASILLYRNSTSTPTTMQICATTPSSNNGIEDNVKITFPDDFTVSSTTSDWTVTTSDIFNDATPWSGIDTATSINGKTVTFPSSDLNADTKYCFRTTNSNALTTASTADNHPGTLETYQGNTIIDSLDFALSVTDDDRIGVSASVPASPSDFEADMALTNPTGDTFPQDTTLTYTLTYGSNLDTPSNITVEAEWETDNGVEVIDYVIGSATDGYNLTPPVVDTVNQKISWEIDSFPANTTGETVTFEIKTNSDYTGDDKIPFDVTGRVVGPGTQTSDSTVTKNYQYDPGADPTPTNTPTSAPTNTPGPSPTNTPTPITSTPTLTPTPSPEELTITDVEVRTLSPNSAQIFTSLSKNADVTLRYGTDQDNLTEEISRANLSSYIITIPQLSPDTQYFFRIIASDNTQTTNSDIFTFNTSEEESEVRPIRDSFRIVSRDLLLHDGVSDPPPQQQEEEEQEEEEDIPKVVLPSNSDFTFYISFENHEQIERIQAFLRRKEVLAATTSEDRNIKSISLVEVKPGEYSVEIDENTIDIGDYELYIRVIDKSGNIFEEKTGELKIDHPFRVIEKDTGRPIGGARVRLFLYSPIRELYSEIRGELLPIENPSITNSRGEINVVLPQGRYKAEITSPNFEDKTVEFAIRFNDEENYPTVELKETPFNVFSYLNYFGQTINDYYRSTSEFIENVANSNRVFNLAGFIVLLSFLLITFQALLSRTHNSVKSIFHYIKHVLTSHKFSIDLPKKGVIKDKNGKAISKAFVSFIKNNEIIFQTSTNINGIFFTNGKDLDHIEISKVGYEDVTFPFAHQIDEKTPVFFLQKHSGYIKNAIDNIIDIFHFVIGMLFEILIIVLLILELLFIPAFGILKVLPFLTLTIIMFIIFIHQNLMRLR